MKVAIIVPVFLTGGAENMASLLALELHRQQVDVEVISMYPRQDHPFEKRLEEAGIRFVAEHELTPETMIRQLKGLEQKFFRKMFAGKMAKKIYRLYEFTSA